MITLGMSSVNVVKISIRNMTFNSVVFAYLAHCQVFSGLVSTELFVSVALTQGRNKSIRFEHHCLKEKKNSAINKETFV